MNITLKNTSRRGLILFALGTLALTASAYDGPTMGWSSWNTFALNINEELIKGQADAMVKTGLAEAGYNYINIDDGFWDGRGADGNLRLNTKLFPRGMRYLTNYIHNLGLKAGIYSDGGDNTCGSDNGNHAWGRGVGFAGHEEQDCKLYFDDWNFDFIKVDYCGGMHLSLNEQEQYTKIGNAIKNCKKKDVVYNICRWAYPGDWVHDIAASWRTTGDIYDAWESVNSILHENLYLSAYCYGGGYNDMDMLEVGRSLTAEEDKTHFGMWCIMSSPLLIGCNLQNIRPDALELLKNKDLIAINQDSLGLQAYVVQHIGETYVMVKDVEKLLDCTRAVALFNPSDRDMQMTVSFDEVDLGGNVEVRDLFEQKDLGVMQDAISVLVPAHGTRIYRLKAEQRLERYIYEGETGYMPCYQEIYNNESVGSGNYQSSSNASGGKFAGWLGNKKENNLQWRNVHILEDGEYTLGFVCGSGDSRTFDVSIDGQKVGTVTAKTENYLAFKEFSLKTTLEKGVHTICLSNANGWMPNIDCMLLHRTGNDQVKARQLTALVNQLRGLSEGCTLPSKMQANIATLLEKAEGSSDASLINQAKTLIDNIAQTLPIMEEFNFWKEEAEKAVADSQESSALETFKQKIEAAIKTLDGAANASTATRAVNNLQTAYKSYLRNVNALPQEGKTLDMTLLLTNPGFSSEDGWSGDKPDFRSNCAQFYNIGSFNMYQSVTNMRPGIYTVGCNALFRIGGNNGGKDYKAGTEVIPAVLYVNDNEVPMLSLYSYNWPDAAQYGGTHNSNGYPNSMYAAELCFSQGAYSNQVETQLDTKGTLRFGLHTTSNLKGYSWCCFDNFTLHFRPIPSEDGIEQIEGQTEQTPTPIMYNLQGQVVSHPQKGIYITNGKKILK